MDEMKMETVKLVPIEANGVTAEGVSVNIPGTELEILQVRCAHGMLFCGIFDKTVLEKLDFPAAVFSAPHFSDMLERKPVFLTTAAKALGANEDMTGAELIACFS